MHDLVVEHRLAEDVTLARIVDRRLMMRSLPFRLETAPTGALPGTGPSGR